MIWMSYMSYSFYMSYKKLRLGHLVFNVDIVEVSNITLF
jgi:hypothetical protein